MFMTATVPDTKIPAAIEPVRATQPAPTGLLARFPAVGLGLLLLGGLLFGLLAANVRSNGPLLAWDLPIDTALHARATHDFWLNFDLMRFSGTLGRETALVITVLLGLVWLWKRHCQAPRTLLLGLIG